MAKAILGVDIGSESLKLALVKGREVKKVVSVPMPENLIKEGRVVSVETMGALIRSTMRKYRLRASRAAYVLSGESVYVRTVTMPVMTADQLMVNLPYEFNDYITEEPKSYIFDYAMLSTPEEIVAREESPSMELMAAAVLRTLIEDAREILRKAGLKLVKAAPVVSCYISLIRAMNGPPDREYCMLDLGYHAIRMYMFKGERHMVTRELEIGFSALDQAIAEAYNVDIHLAHTYMLNNFDDCLTKEFAMNAYNTISVELMRAMNFYRFSNPDSQLSELWVCGGGAVIEALQLVLESTLDMKVHSAEELMPGKKRVLNAHSFVQAVGIALD